jgi:acyl carrier protein
MLMSEEKMRETLALLLNVEVKNIYPSTSLRHDLFLDDIDLKLLISALELRMGVYLSDEEASSIDTVQDLTYNLQRRAAA